MAAHFHPRIDCDLAELKRVMDEAEGFLESHGVDARVVFGVNLALEEIITNIIKYGCDAAAPRQIEIAIEAETEEVSLAIRHEGREFNPMRHERKAASPDLAGREVGGLGIFLVKKMLDQMDYRHEDGRNIVLIKIRRRTDASAA